MNEHVKTWPRDNWGIQAQDAPIIRDTEEPTLGRGVTGVVSGFGHVSPPPHRRPGPRRAGLPGVRQPSPVPVEDHGVGGGAARSTHRVTGADRCSRSTPPVTPSCAAGPARRFRHRGSSMGFAAASGPGREGHHRAGHGGFRVVQDSEGYGPTSGAPGPWPEVRRRRPRLSATRHTSRSASLMRATT